jgi:hypothetical protein
VVETHLEQEDASAPFGFLVGYPIIKIIRAGIETRALAIIT